MKCCNLVKACDGVLSSPRSPEDYTSASNFFWLGIQNSQIKLRVIPRDSSATDVDGCYRCVETSLTTKIDISKTGGPRRKTNFADMSGIRCHHKDCLKLLLSFADGEEPSHERSIRS